MKKLFLMLMLSSFVLHGMQNDFETLRNAERRCDSRAHKEALEKLLDKGVAFAVLNESIRRFSRDCLSKSQPPFTFESPEWLPMVRQTSMSVPLASSHADKAKMAEHKQSLAKILRALPKK
jgi:hypothetical protein